MVEEIVLLDEADEVAGRAPKTASHHRHTPYHLAFSCFLVDPRGRVLITRRALGKRTFPGVWTGSCCGHPAPGEGLREAVLRRLDTELGVSAESVTPVLPAFRYRATAADGVVENERCPVVRAVTSGQVTPNPDEVETAEWWTWDRCLELAERPDSSPWYRLQLAELAPLGAPLDWPDAGTDRLPPALRW
ncbi:isopentenyl-diphosphate Delta-isomerase [Actinomadura keratinilytica]|jgi:isopentenyl-diphosphate delta-isomerase|uniref:Isopentenyl-diphosphate Delta-isomerase n=1 Tax=Actinomadura keratinilytica TaxID=547461 RepID=A0ABP7YV44_9ACTN